MADKIMYAHTATQKLGFSEASYKPATHNSVCGLNAGTTKLSNEVMSIHRTVCWLRPHLLIHSHVLSMDKCLLGPKAGIGKSKMS